MTLTRYTMTQATKAWDGSPAPEVQTDQTTISVFSVCSLSMRAIIALSHIKTWHSQSWTGFGQLVLTILWHCASTLMAKIS
ncbi:MAG: hypothetical protein VX631_07230 [Pseudomonadota bacterium]|nr:hypothetical protein [Pseudomonadota bacterium]